MTDHNNNLENEPIDKPISIENETGIDEVEAEEIVEPFEEEDEIIEAEADEIAEDILKLKSEKISLENLEYP